MYETFNNIDLVCLYKIGVIGDSDLQALILKVFAFYLAVCRNLQQVYWLEPAGSHGVWSLDDYQMFFTLEPLSCTVGGTLYQYR